MDNKKIKIFFFHSFSELGGVDLSISRLINYSDSKKFDIEFISLNKPKIKRLVNKPIKYKVLNKKRTIASIFDLKFLAAYEENPPHPQPISRTLEFSFRLSVSAIL